MLPKYIFTTLPTPKLCPAAIPDQTIPNKNSLLTQIKLLSLTYVTSTFHLLKTRPPKNHQKLNGGVLSHRNTPISHQLLGFSSYHPAIGVPMGALNSAEPGSWSPPSAAWLAASVLVAPPGWGWQRNRRCPTGNARALSFREILSHWAFNGEHDGIHHKILWIYIEIYINIQYRKYGMEMDGMGGHAIFKQTHLAGFWSLAKPQHEQIADVQPQICQDNGAMSSKWWDDVRISLGWIVLQRPWQQWDPTWMVWSSIWRPRYKALGHFAPRSQALILAL